MEAHWGGLLSQLCWLSTEDIAVVKVHGTKSFTGNNQECLGVRAWETEHHEHSEVKPQHPWCFWSSPILCGNPPPPPSHAGVLRVKIPQCGRCNDITSCWYHRVLRFGCVHMSQNASSSSPPHLATLASILILLQIFSCNCIAQLHDILFSFISVFSNAVSLAMWTVSLAMLFLNFPATVFLFKKFSLWHRSSCPMGNCSLLSP